jgi:hypothetical protein
MMALGRLRIPLLTSVVVAALCGCGPQMLGNAAPNGAAAPAQRHRLPVSSSGDCPANTSGTGILPDGDFSQAPDLGDAFIEPKKGYVFAPSWEVAKRNIDFNGSTFWDVGGFCSVDLDGNNAGGIVTSAFATQRGANYTVTFLLSGNGGEGKGNPPVVKTMKIEAANQFTVFTWDTANDNDAEHGKYAAQTWQFKAKSSLTSLRFTSLDHKSSSRGAIVAAIAITEEL